MSDENPNGWNEYSKLVLKELETLASNIDGLQVEIHALRTEITKLQSNESKIDEIKDWKDKVNEVSSPTQMKEYIDKVDDLNAFKIKAIGGFASVQFIIVIVGFFLKFT